MNRGLATAGVQTSPPFDGNANSALSSRVAGSDRVRWALLGCAACLYVPLIFAGPGSDPDSKRELHSGLTLLWQHRYVMSRPPGYFPYEALCGFLCQLGGSVANNLATIAMSLALLDAFLGVCRHFEVPNRYLLATTMALHPVYWAASTSTIDFLWALGCFFVGFRLLLDCRYFAGAAMLGLAVGIRLSSVLLAGPLLIWKLTEHPRDARPWCAAALATAIGAALYIPEFISSGSSLRFLTYYVGPWTFGGYLGRFIYKNVYFWGLPATMLLIAAAPRMIRTLAECGRRSIPIVVLSLSIVLLFEVLFLKIPVQRAYLLPMLPFILILLGFGLRGRERMLFAIAIAVFSYNFINLNLARPDVADQATHARLGFFVERGYLLNDVAARLDLARRQSP
jgi:hypothetical protein